MSGKIRTLPALYRDSTMRKEGESKRLVLVKYGKLQESLRSVQKEREKVGEMIRIEDLRMTAVDRIKEEIKKRYVLIDKMDAAAILIQKHSKRLKKIREERDENNRKLEKILQQSLDELEPTVNYIFWNLGNAAEAAAKKIKAAYKRSKFREKIQRLKKAYKIMSKNKKTLCRIIIRKGIRNGACLIKLEKMREEKEEREKIEKLVIIRKKLAFITIKLFWKQNRISFRRFMFKIRKYKKIILRQKSNYLSADLTMHSDISSYLSTPRAELIIATENSKNEEIAKLAAMKLMKERDNRITKSFLSYRIRKVKVKHIPPLNLSVAEENNDRILMEKTAKMIKSPMVGKSNRTLSFAVWGYEKSQQSFGSLSTRSGNRHQILRL
jgi:hypothetical protein